MSINYCESLLTNYNIKKECKGDFCQCIKEEARVRRKKRSISNNKFFLKIAKLFDDSTVNNNLTISHSKFFIYPASKTIKVRINKKKYNFKTQKTFTNFCKNIIISEHGNK